MKLVLVERLFVIAGAVAVTACSHLPNLPSLTPHRMEIQQGNFVTQDMLGQLRPGMTKDQVRFAMGTPLVTDVFHANRWDYIFVRRPADSNKTERRHIWLIFKGNKLARVEGDVVSEPSESTKPGSPAAARQGSKP